MDTNAVGATTTVRRSRCRRKPHPVATRTAASKANAQRSAHPPSRRTELRFHRWYDGATVSEPDIVRVDSYHPLAALDHRVLDVECSRSLDLPVTAGETRPGGPLLAPALRWPVPPAKGEARPKTCCGASAAPRRTDRRSSPPGRRSDQRRRDANGLVVGLLREEAPRLQRLAGPPRATGLCVELDGDHSGRGRGPPSRWAPRCWPARLQPPPTRAAFSIMPSSTRTPIAARATRRRAGCRRRSSRARPDSARSSPPSSRAPPTPGRSRPRAPCL